MRKLIIRHDDFDWRMPAEFYIAVHDYFIANDLVETAVIQISQHGRLPDFEKKRDLIDYMNTAPNWDIQLHGWSHDHYHEMAYDDIVRDISAALFHFQRLFNRLPRVWYPPYNKRTEEMERAAATLGLVIDNEEISIKQFVDGVGWVKGRFTGHSCHFHGWNQAEMEYFEKMIELAKEVVWRE